MTRGASLPPSIAEIRANPHLPLSPHFIAWEFLTSTGGVRGDRVHLLTPARLDSLCRVVDVLEELRAGFDRPIRITSGLRPPTSTPSQHHEGQAADIQIDGVSPIEVMRWLWRRWHGTKDPLVRQIIGETMKPGLGDLDLPMAAGSGRWVHIAVFGATPYVAPSVKPWCVSCLPPAGEQRKYPAWSPT